MNPLRLVLCALLVAVAQTTPAVQPAGAPPPTRSGPAEGDLIERGGIVDAVDAGRMALVVDGRPYTIPRGSVRIHLSGNRVSSALADLKRGMQIRFTSVADRGSQQIQIREIWVTGMSGR